MARRHAKRSTSQILFYILSLLIVLSMAVGYVLIAAPASNPAPSPATPAPGRTVQPTAVPPTATAPAPTITPVPLPVRPTADAAATQYSFGVIGDSQGNADVYEALLKQVEADGNAFLIHLGGIAKTGAEAEFQSWRETMADFALPFYTAPGATDLKSGSPANYLAFTGARGLRYSFDHGMVHFAVVDASRGYLTVEDSAWLDADLAGTQKAVKVVALHAPPFDPGGSDQVMTRGNEAFVTMMKQRGVKYVFAGSVHAYNQTAQDGVTYVMSGGGGAPLSRAEADGGFYHYVRVSVNGADVSIEAHRVQ